MLDGDYEVCVPPHLRAAMKRLRDPQRVWDIFRADDTIAEMERLTARNRPAVGAASEKLLALGDWVRGNDARKTFGKITRCVMEARGYAISSKGVETPDDPLFTRGTRYRLRQPINPLPTVANLTIRDIESEIFARLQARAARSGRSVESEALHTLRDALADGGRKNGLDLAKAIHQRFAALGGIEELPPHPAVSTEPPELDR